MDDCKRYASYYAKNDRKESDVKKLCEDLKHENAKLTLRVNKLEDEILGLKHSLRKLTPSE
jgi:cell division protein FtsB